MALKDLSIIEREIIGRFLDRVNALATERDVKVVVRDEEEIVFNGSFDRHLIEFHIGNTDLTKITVIISAAERHTTLFVHGNDEDVVSDSGFTDAGEWLEEKLLKGVYS